VFTRYNYIKNAWKCQSPKTPTTIVKSKWWDIMINYTSWPIILLNMKTIKPTTSDELCSQDITILKIHENVKVPQPLQQSSNQIISCEHNSSEVVGLIVFIFSRIIGHDV
jgi:hypothetical protein